MRLRRFRRAWTVIQTARAIRAGGHIHPSTLNALASGLKTRRLAPARAISAAGTSVHRWGWSDQRIESTANNVQPRAHPSSAVPMITCSSAPPNGPMTNTRATTSPAIRDPATIRPMWPLRIGLAASLVSTSNAFVLARTFVIVFLPIRWAHLPERDYCLYAVCAPRGDSRSPRSRASWLAAARLPSAQAGTELGPEGPLSACRRRLRHGVNELVWLWGLYADHQQVNEHRNFSDC